MTGEVQTSAAPAATPQPPAEASAVKTPEGADIIYRTQADYERAIGERVGREREKFEREYEAKIQKAKDDATADTAKGFELKLVNTAAKSIARDLGFHDPVDALAAISADKLPVKDGEADDEAIKKLLEDLVKSKPYLAKAADSRPVVKASGKPKLPQGNSSDSGEKPMKAAEALRALAAQRKH